MNDQHPLQSNLQQLSIIQSSDKPTLPPTDLFCVGCLEILPTASFPQTPISSRCAPLTHQICTACTTPHLDNQMANKMWNTITCPVDGCAALLSPADIAVYASPANFTRYSNARSSATVPQFVTCAAAACLHGQVHPSGSVAADGTRCAVVPLVVCEACGVETCFVHQMPFHTGLSCAEFDMLPREEDAWGGVLAKKCPGCAAWTARDEGCPQMKCYCGTDFCWGCLGFATFDENKRGYAHAEGCTADEEYRHNLYKLPRF